MNKLGRRRLSLDTEAIVRDYQSGMSLHECALKHGCVMDTIWRRLIEAGCERRPPSQNNQPPKHDYEPAIAAYQAGTSLREAAALVNRSASRFVQVLRERGIPRRPANPKPQDRPEVVELYLTGLSAHEVAERFHVSGETVRKALDRAGVPRRPRNSQSPAKQRERIARWQELAVGTGDAASRARHKLRKLGLLD